MKKKQVFYHQVKSIDYSYYYFLFLPTGIGNNIDINKLHRLFAAKTTVEFQNILTSLICIQIGEKNDGNIIQTSKVNYYPSLIKTN